MIQWPEVDKGVGEEPLRLSESPGCGSATAVAYKTKHLKRKLYDVGLDILTDRKQGDGWLPVAVLCAAERAAPTGSRRAAPPERGSAAQAPADSASELEF